MFLVEKVAYLKGLVTGLEIDNTTKEGKLFEAIVDVLDEMSVYVSKLEENQLEMEELLDILDQDLCEVEETIYDSEEQDICEDESCEMTADEHFEEDYDDSDTIEEEVYEVVCPSCENSLYIDYDMLSKGEMNCPNCSEYLEFDVSSSGEDNLEKKS